MDVRWRALAVLTLARTSMGIQFQSLPSVSTGVMQDLGLGYADIGWLVGLYFLPGVLVALPAGAAGRRYGDRHVVLAGAMLMFAGGLIAAAYRPHPNERAQAQQPQRRLGLGRRELILLCIAGAMWGALNGAFAIMTSFAPLHLVHGGLAAATAAAVVATATWAVVLSVQVGGILAHKWEWPRTLFAIGCIGWALCAFGAAMFPDVAASAVIGAGLALGLPIGLILALPGQILQPSQRAMGMAIFYLWLYAGHGTLPAVAGWAQDRLASTSASLVIVGMLALGILGLYGLVRVLSAAWGQAAAAPARLS